MLRHGKNGCKLLSSYYSQRDMDKAYEYCLSGLNPKKQFDYKKMSQEQIQNIVAINTQLHKNKVVFMNYTEHRSIPEDYEFLKSYNNKEFVNKKKHDKIRIGYISPDFNKNAVGLFLTALSKYYDKDKFEIYCYYTNKSSDEFTKLLKSYIEPKNKKCMEPTNWFNVGYFEMNELVALINCHELNILIDLLPHGFDNFQIDYARITCGTIINYLGFPNTSGMPYVTHRITDRIADPDEVNRQYYSERLVYMPRCFICYTLFENINMPDIIQKNNDNKVYLGIMNRTEKQTEKMRKL